MTDVAGYWARQLANPRSEEFNRFVRDNVDAVVDRHRGRTITEYGRLMTRDDLGLPPMPDAFYAFWLGRDGCL